MTTLDLYQTMHTQPDWYRDALCAQVDPDLWFPHKGSNTVPAKLICQTCPVVEECLAYALANSERYGIWGGYSERERRRLARGQRFAPAIAVGGGNRVHQLTEEQEFDLLNLLAQGWTQVRVAEYFDVSVAAVRRIRNRHNRINKAAA